MRSIKSTNESVSHLLENAEASVRSGKFPEALNVLESATTNVTAQDGHPDYWSGMIAASTARVKLHMWDHAGAQSCLALIQDDLRRANPKIDAEYHTINGMILRRQAHELWKRGDIQSAHNYAGNSIDAFDFAIDAARMALDDRLKYGAILNQQYARGLSFSIASRKQEDFLDLFMDAAKAEAKSRESTAPVAKDNLTGLTIVVDLALGSGVEAKDATGISTDIEYQAACLSVFGRTPNTWPQVIVNHVREAQNNRPEIVAAALALGGKILLSDENAANRDICQEYAMHLQCCYLDLKSTSNNVRMMERISSCLSRFPSEIVRKVTSPKYFR